MSKATATHMTRRAALLGALATAAPAALVAPALAAPAPHPDAELLALEAKRIALWEAACHGSEEEADAHHDAWADAVEEIADTPAAGIRGMQVKARALEEYSRGCVIETSPNSIDGKLLGQILAFVLTGAAS